MSPSLVIVVTKANDAKNVATSISFTNSRNLLSILQQEDAAAGDAASFASISKRVPLPTTMCFHMRHAFATALETFQEVTHVNIQRAIKC
jgi:hypothetical protein